LARNIRRWGQAFLAQPHVGVLAGAGLIFFAFLGFEDIANLAEEAKRPERDVPRAILIAVAASTVLYILVAVSSVALRSPERLAASLSALADAMRAGEPRLAGALGGVALFATANTALIAMTAASRMLLGMARGGDAPGALRRTLHGRKTPALAIGLVTVGTLAFLPLGRRVGGKRRVADGARGVRFRERRAHPAPLSRAWAQAAIPRPGLDRKVPDPRRPGPSRDVDSPRAVRG
jgi:amino acid transporter